MPGPQKSARMLIMSCEGQAGTLRKIDCSGKRRLELASLAREEG